jgi:hypothetical protein
MHSPLYIIGALQSASVTQLGAVTTSACSCILGLFDQRSNKFPTRQHF